MTVELSAEDLDLSGIIRAGDSVFVGQGCAEPLPLTAALVRQRSALGGVRVFLGPVFSDTWQPQHTDHIAFSGYGALGNGVRLARAGALDVLPAPMSQLPALLASGALPCDVALLQLSEANAGGEYSLGIANDYLLDAARRARVVIAEISAQVPWTYGGEALRDLRIDYCVRTARPPLQLKPAPIGEVERRIAAHAAPLIPNGAVLQTGIGAIPEAILSALDGHRDLGVHSGLMGDGLARLMERGVVTNARKRRHRGQSVAGVLFGTDALYRFAHDNPALLLRPVTHTHNVTVLGGLERFVAINSAIEVDLTGQVNAEVAGADYIGAVGGQADFVRGAWLSPGGRSIIALPATAKGGTRSRVVAALTGGIATTPRCDADLIVTEWGVADLRGQGLRERVRRMLAVAHPDFREHLARAAAALKLGA